MPQGLSRLGIVCKDRGVWCRPATDGGGGGRGGGGSFSASRQKHALTLIVTGGAASKTLLCRAELDEAKVIPAEKRLPFGTIAVGVPNEKARAAPEMPRAALPPSPARPHT